MRQLAVIGATGLVGEQLLAIMAAKGIAAEVLGLYASADSARRTLAYDGFGLEVQELAGCDFSMHQAAFFCIGDELSAEYVPRALAAGCAVVDKSNAYRLADGVPLVVAGVNDAAVDADARLVANPNCTTIVLSHALAPLARRFGLKRVWVATYQSVSGAGKKGVEALIEGTASSGFAEAGDIRAVGDPAEVPFNVVARIGGLDQQGRASEEAKLIAETKKILATPQLGIIAHAVRVPVLVGHSMAVTLELEEAADAEDVAAAWADSPDVKFMANALPTPVAASRHEQVEVGRLRREQVAENCWSFFACGDNLNLGAALNGWRIYKLMQAAGSVPKITRRAGHG